jgi:hypothetical protein
VFNVTTNINTILEGSLNTLSKYGIGNLFPYINYLPFKEKGSFIVKTG